jgi:hypothetical protein
MRQVPELVCSTVLGWCVVRLVVRGARRERKAGRNETGEARGERERTGAISMDVKRKSNCRLLTFWFQCMLWNAFRMV